MRKSFLTALSLVFVAGAAHAQKISNLDEVRRALGLDRLSDSVLSQRPVKIAILDKAFYKVEREFGRTLPRNTVYVKGSVPVPDDLKSDHGVRMAQMVTGLVTDDLKYADRIELRLYNAFGYTNFKSAIADVVARKTDIVLYSEVWEYGGNLDGRGFINAEVDRALDAGVLWVNAAGNFGKTTYNGPVRTGDEDWVQLPDQNRALKIVCRAKRGQKCGMKIVLSWNDFKDDSEEGTDKDLDLALTDDLLNVVQSSSLRQTTDRRETSPGMSMYPREIVAAQVKPGTYFVRVKDSSRNFDSNDRLRITVDGDAIEMPSAQPQESLLVPADNPRVLTVGASDSDRSGRSARLGKPDLLAISSIKLDDGGEFRGSSNSAAFTAAAAALLKLNGVKLSREEVLRKSRAFDWDRGILSLAQLRFAPTLRDPRAPGMSCFADGTWNDAPAYVQRIIDLGARPVVTTAGWRLMTPFDPATLFPELSRRSPDDMFVVTARGPAVYPRFAPIPPGAVEVFARPREAGLCNRPSPSMGRVLGF